MLPLLSRLENNKIVVAKKRRHICINFTFIILFAKAINTVIKQFGFINSNSYNDILKQYMPV